MYINRNDLVIISYPSDSSGFDHVISCFCDMLVQICDVTLIAEVIADHEFMNFSKLHNNFFPVG